MGACEFARQLNLEDRSAILLDYGQIWAVSLAEAQAQHCDMRRLPEMET
jgi:hypothetical protein